MRTAVLCRRASVVVRRVATGSLRVYELEWVIRSGYCTLVWKVQARLWFVGEVQWLGRDVVRVKKRVGKWI
jgi:hypothetical protein